MQLHINQMCRYHISIVFLNTFFSFLADDGPVFLVIWILEHGNDSEAFKSESMEKFVVKHNMVVVELGI